MSMSTRVQEYEYKSMSTSMRTSMNMSMSVQDEYYDYRKSTPGKGKRK